MKWCHLGLVGLALLALAVETGCRRDEQSHPDAAGDAAPGRDTDAGRTADAGEPRDTGLAADAGETGDADTVPDGGGEDGDAGLDADAGDPDAGIPFSFAVLADPHVDGNPAHREYLVRAVDRLIEERDAWGIELVFIVGDIAWGGTAELTNLADAKGILDQLQVAGMHYVPVLGDNEVQAGDDQEFHEVFSAQYQHLAGVLEGWQQMPTPVNGYYMQSFSFEHRGCHFVSADFISRDPGSEAAELHDFAGGSWPWFQADIETAAHGPAERVNVFTHHGMFLTGFSSVDRYLISTADMEQIVEFLCPYRDHVAATYGGHIHQNWIWEVSCSSGELIYEVWITDDGFDAVVPPEQDDDRITIRVVEVSKTADGFVYEQHLIVEPISVE